jgi:hypothetical protein
LKWKRDSNTSKRDFVISWTVWVKWKHNFIVVILKPDASFFEATIHSFCGEVNRFWNLLVCGIFNFVHLPLLPSTDMLFCSLKFFGGVDNFMTVCVVMLAFVHFRVAMACKNHRDRFTLLLLAANLGVCYSEIPKLDKIIRWTLILHVKKGRLNCIFGP